MWFRRAIAIILSAYLGGLLASYVILIATPGALASSTLRAYPFYFALGISIFTVPGAIVVAAIYRVFRLNFAPASSYGLAIMCGAVLGGAILWVLTPTSLGVFGIGAFFGFATASVWAGVNRYILPTL